eukprot:CAMPEP_0204276710 /NCGR_PEP_ID=MMETSP0468-20130131/28683_1 /ASSEMBLY_ACC=CAM_ASM_000383 /TAXON_ID=2969 /ORGANISM="Oxyrrhis marina" /LENGTH=636 /DNA_ID=CAMNT_0051253385 /DNA_START=73 /DNA_END=1983 /DNA_ORIENTATION=-
MHVLTSFAAVALTVELGAEEAVTSLGAAQRDWARAAGPHLEQLSQNQHTALLQVEEPEEGEEDDAEGGKKICCKRLKQAKKMFKKVHAEANGYYQTQRTALLSISTQMTEAEDLQQQITQAKQDAEKDIKKAARQRRQQCEASEKFGSHLAELRAMMGESTGTQVSLLMAQSRKLTRRSRGTQALEKAGLLDETESARPHVEPAVLLHSRSVLHAVRTLAACEATQEDHQPTEEHCQEQKEKLQHEWTRAYETLTQLQSAANGDCGDTTVEEGYKTELQRLVADLNRKKLERVESVKQQQGELQKVQDGLAEAEPLLTELDKSIRNLRKECKMLTLSTDYLGHVKKLVDECKKCPGMQVHFQLPSGRTRLAIGQAAKFSNPSSKPADQSFGMQFGEQPALLVGPLSRRGGHAAVAEVVSSSLQGLALGIREPACGYDNKHTKEDVAWMALEQGEFKTDQNVHFQVGRVSVTGMGPHEVAFTTDKYPIKGSAIVVVASLSSGNSGAWMNVRIKQATPGGFSFVLNSEKQDGTNEYTEEVTFVAIPQGKGTIYGHHYQAELFTKSLTHKFNKYSFEEQEKPAIFASASYRGKEPAGIRMKAEPGSKVSLMLDEPKECWGNGAHTAEDVHLLVIDEEMK